MKFLDHPTGLRSGDLVRITGPVDVPPEAQGIFPKVGTVLRVSLVTAPLTGDSSTDTCTHHHIANSGREFIWCETLEKLPWKYLVQRIHMEPAP